MLIVQRIKNGLPLPAAANEPCLLQDAQLVGDGGLGHVQEFCNVAHAHLRLEQHVQNAYPGGVPEHLEQLRKVVQPLLVRHLRLHTIQDLRVGAHLLADLRILSSGHTVLLKHMNICSYVSIDQRPSSVNISNKKNAAVSPRRQLVKKSFDKLISLSAKAGRSRFFRPEAVLCTARGRKNC